MNINENLCLYDNVDDLEEIVGAIHGELDILIVTGASIYKGQNSIIKSIENKFNARLITSSGEILTFEEVKRCYALVENKQPDLIVAIGGGRVLDLAKLLANPHLLDRLGEVRYLQPVKVVSVPTTAGSGSETTPFSALYVDGKKISIDAPSLKPAYTILDVNLLKTTPKSVAVAASFDAICQSIEAILAKRSTDESDQIAYNALKLAWDHQISSFVSTDSLKVLSFAAYESGRAISITRTTLPHALSYYLTIQHGIKHGHAVALSMARYLHILYHKAKNDRNESVWLDKLNQIFSIMDMDASTVVEKWEKRMGMLDLIPRVGHIVNDKNVANNAANNVNAQRMENAPYVFTKIECAAFF